MTTTVLPDSTALATTAPWPGEDDGDEGRLQRGLAIAATTPYVKVAGGWLTPSQSDPDVLYRLARDEDGAYCECPDYARRGTACKHIFGLELVLKREQLSGTVKTQVGENRVGKNGHTAVAVLDEPAPTPAPEPESVRPAIHRKPETNPAPPPAMSPPSTLYNAAQENESRHFIRLLWDLVNTVPKPPSGRGRRRADLRKALYGVVHRVYTTKSGRRSYSDLQIASEILGLGALPSRPTVTRYMEDPNLTPILEHLVEVSAVPLSPLETGFSVDSSGFGTTIRDEPWADAKWGDAESRRSFTGTTWTKAHYMVGNRTNVITAAFVTPTLANSGDSPQFRRLLAITSQHFNIQGVHADKAYLSGKNLKAIIDEGAKAYVPFKKSSVYRDPTAKNGKLWNDLLHHFRNHTEEFYRGYHQRSNVESDFSAVKRLFDDLTRSICPVARVNEVLAKAVAYNITRVVHARYSHGIEPVYGS